MTGVSVFGRVVGFILGFGIATVGILVLNMMYRGVWMPIGLFFVLGALFSWHPRLTKAPGSAWYLAFAGLIGVVIWMLNVGPSPLRFPGAARGVPLLFFLLSLPLLIVFLRRNRDAEPGRVIYFPIALAFAALVWVVISLSGSSGGADPMVQFVMDRLSLSKGAAEALIIAFRKTVHFVGYGLVAWTAYRIANPKFDVRAAAWFGGGAALSVGVFDEFRQALTTNRTGSVWDIGLDMLGALTFLSISVLRYRRHLQPPNPSPRLSA
jgi:VanZ family protein